MGVEHQASHTSPPISIWFTEAGSGLAWWPLWLCLVPQETEFL